MITATLSSNAFQNFGMPMWIHPNGNSQWMFQHQASGIPHQCSLIKVQGRSWVCDCEPATRGTITISVRNLQLVQSVRLGFKCVVVETEFINKENFYHEKNNHCSFESGFSGKILRRVLWEYSCVYFLHKKRGREKMSPFFLSNISDNFRGNVSNIYGTLRNWICFSFSSLSHATTHTDPYHMQMCGKVFLRVVKALVKKCRCNRH